MFIDYAKLIDEAMHIIVKKSLTKIAEEGLQNDHHFYISFLTQHEGVELSKKLKAKYPEEMTIVLQYQYEDLKVEDDKFTVSLSFGGLKEKIVIPYDALTAFADPSVKFGLQFRHMDEANIEDDLSENLDENIDKTQKKKQTAQAIVESKADNVITMDSFRKKK